MFIILPHYPHFCVYISILTPEEFTEDIYNDLYDNKMVPIMEKDLKEMQNRMYRSLYVTYIISVDRLTSYFSEFVKGLEQDRRYFWTYVKFLDTFLWTNC